MEMAKFMGLSHAGAPVMTRGSTRSPVRATISTIIIDAPTNASGRFEAQARPKRLRGPGTLTDRAVMPHPLGGLLCSARVLGPVRSLSPAAPMGAPAERRPPAAEPQPPGS